MKQDADLPLVGLPQNPLDGRVGIQRMVCKTFIPEEIIGLQ